MEQQVTAIPSRRVDGDSLPVRADDQILELSKSVKSEYSEVKFHLPVQIILKMLLDESNRFILVDGVQHDGASNRIWSDLFYRRVKSFSIVKPDLFYQRIGSFSIGESSRSLSLNHILSIVQSYPFLSLIRSSSIELVAGRLLRGQQILFEKVSSS
jgi:hypothetical protein